MHKLNIKKQRDNRWCHCRENRIKVKECASLNDFFSKIWLSTFSNAKVILYNHLPIIYQMVIYPLLCSGFLHAVFNT